MTNTEKQKVVQETIIELHRALKALQALDRGMTDDGAGVSTVISAKAKRESMNATRALAKFRRS